VVADGSTDQTASPVARLAEANPNVRCLRSPYSSGFGFAVRAGHDAFEGDAVAIMMADGSDDPGDLVNYLRLLQAGYDCAFGSRFMRGAQVDGYPRGHAHAQPGRQPRHPPARRPRLHDTTNAFKSYRCEVIENVSRCCRTTSTSR
jgi:dolichol-phosphate mannosyltransferase